MARYERFLRQLARRYGSVLRAEGSEEADDLLHAFFVDRLPRVAERLGSLADEDQREKYLSVAFHNFARDHQRAASRYRHALQELATEVPEVALSTFQPAEALHAAGVDLHPAVRAYFDGRGGPASLRKIAEQLGITRYAARKAVVDGALVLALRLGKQAILDAREVDVCQQVLQEGRSIAHTAEYLGLTETQVKQALAAAREAVGRYIQHQQ